MRLDSTYEMINKKKYKMDIIMLHFVVSSNEVFILKFLKEKNIKYKPIKMIEICIYIYL